MSGSISAMISSVKMNLAARRKGPFLSRNAFETKTKGSTEKYQFPETSERMKQDVRKKIQARMKLERRVSWIVGLTTLIILIAILL